MNRISINALVELAGFLKEIMEMRSLETGPAINFMSVEDAAYRVT